jgi:multidrug efflux pump
MVLAIGLLVDDAIVVVENIERIMSEEGLGPREATIRSMDEITGALVGIALVLSAVFLPMAFFGGSTGVIYRQFSVTIVSAMALSVFVALVLTPALCASLLKPKVKGEALAQRGFFGWFNRNFARAVARYERDLAGVIARPPRALIIYGLIVLVMAALLARLPSSFLPEEDQGVIMTLFSLPAGSILQRTTAVARRVQDYYLTKEKHNVDNIFVVSGFSFAGNGQNQGMGFLHMKNWRDRPGPQNRSAAVARRATMAFQSIRDAQVFALAPPAVQELGNTTGFDLQLEDQGGIGHDALVKARNQLLGMAARDPLLFAVRPNSPEDTPQLHIDIDPSRSGSLGLSRGDINDTLSAAWGGVYINDFVDRGRVKRVYMQGDAPFRMNPDDLGLWYVRSATGSMAPFSAFATTRWAMGPAELDRFNGFPSLEVQGQAAPGKSSGAAMAEIERLVAKLPAGVGYEWTGLSFQEQLSGSQAPLLYALSILVVFLCLAALYESWSIPLSVLLVIPLGVVGAVLAATLRGLYDDIYFQVGLLTTIGLSAKNAILIVEFAEEAERRGQSAREAAMAAARLRLRPILMTSMAFVAGVFPLTIASGPGAASQNDIGTGVVGGMISATIFAIFLVPLFYVGVRGLFARGRRPVAVGPAPGAAE